MKCSIGLCGEGKHLPTFFLAVSYTFLSFALFRPPPVRILVPTSDSFQPEYLLHFVMAKASKQLYRRLRSSCSAISRFKLRQLLEKRSFLCRFRLAAPVLHSTLKVQNYVRLVKFDSAPCTRATVCFVCLVCTFTLGASRNCTTVAPQNLRSNESA